MLLHMKVLEVKRLCNLLPPGRHEVSTGQRHIPDLLLYRVDRHVAADFEHLLLMLSVDIIQSITCLRPKQASLLGYDAHLIVCSRAICCGSLPESRLAYPGVIYFISFHSPACALNWMPIGRPEAVSPAGREMEGRRKALSSSMDRQ